MSPHSHPPRSRTQSTSDNEFGPAFKARKRRHHRNHAYQIGRLHLFLLFLWMRVWDVILIWGIAPKLSTMHRSYLMLLLGVAAVWTTGLLAAAWFRQNWARYLLALSLIVGVVISLAMIPMLPDIMHARKAFYAILIGTVLYLPVGIVLLGSRPIHKLTQKDQFNYE